MILLTPGPCMTSETVRQAAAQLDLNHRDPEYASISHGVRDRLRKLGDGYSPYVIGGGGTMAMEAMVTSCISDGKCLIVSNGFYAERYTRILNAHRIEYEDLRLPWTDAWDTAKIEQRLFQGNISTILATHHETSTGRLNPINELVRIARKYNVKVLIDCVSSIGAEDIGFDGVHAVCGSANKCLHGIPGVSFVLVEPSFAREIETYEQRTYSLHLPLYAPDRAPHTPPTAAMRGFRQALVEFEEQGGLQARHERYVRQAKHIRTTLSEQGFSFFTPEEESSCAVTVATIPEDFTSESWLKANYEAGYALFECKGELRGNHFQVSTMGEVTDVMVDAWLKTTQRLVQ